MGKLLDELKRRKVFRVAAIYAVVAWVLIQVADVVLPTFGAPTWVNQTLIFLFILGLFPTLIAAWAYEVTPEGIKTDPAYQTSAQAPAPQSQALIYAIFVLVLLVAGFQIADRFLFAPQQSISPTAIGATQPQSTGVMRSSINLDAPLTRDPSWRMAIEFDLSRDGTQLVYTLYSTDSSTQTFVRNLASQETRLISETIISPKIFPDDSRVIGSIRGQNAMGLVPILGGVSTIMTIGQDNAAVSWLSDDEILYPSRDYLIHRRALLTGDDVILTQEDEAAIFHLRPYVLPGANAFLYDRVSFNQGGNSGDVIIHNLLNGDSKTLINGGYMASYASSGHVVFLRSGDLWAVPFDLERQEITGQEARVIEGIESFPNFNYGSYVFSDTGRLIYLPGQEIIPFDTALNWIDRLGNKQDILLPSGTYADPELSPDEASLALTITQEDGTSDIWIHDLSGGTLGRRTFSGTARNPKWSPDSSILVYQLDEQGIWQINADGTGQPTQLTAELNSRPDSFTGIDKELLYLVGEPGNDADINKLSFRDNTWISTPLLNTQFNEFGAVVSPDGRWLAYVTNESGRSEVFVRPYPDVESGKWQISTESGREPKWNASGNELFYLQSFTGDLMTVTINTENGFSPGIPQTLFSGFRFAGLNPPNYAVSNDGERFIQFRSDTYTDEDLGTGNISSMVVKNWFEELRRLAPPDPQ